MATVEIEQHRRRCLDLRAERSRIEAELAEAEAELAQIVRKGLGLRRHSDRRMIGQPPPRPLRQRQASRIALETVRDAVVALGRGGGAFTLSELAARLDCSQAQARQQLRRERIVDMVELVDEPGRKRWRYVKPTEAGEAFENQRRLRAVPMMDDVADLAMAGDGQAAQNLLSSIARKEILKVVKEAIREGWQLKRGGPKALVLVRDGHQPITVVSSPRDPDVAADELRRKIRRRQRIAL